MASVYVFYHFYFPDDVISALHIQGLCEGLAKRGWEVTVFTSNRACRYSKMDHKPRKERLNGVEVVRCWRPDFNQASNLGRLANAIWIMVQWYLQARSRSKPDAMIVGTDPQLSQILIPRLKSISPTSKLYFWCFDVYPDAIIADRKLPGFLLRWLRNIAKHAYRSVDVMVDIGSCMRQRLVQYEHQARVETLVPWAIFEPKKPPRIDLNVRKKLFAGAKLAIHYSGNLGVAHEYELFIDLARRLQDRNVDVCFSFSVRGNRVRALQQSLQETDTNIRVLPFVDAKHLPTHLAAADIHMISLHQQWCGIVVPSKFFGALAIGKPILYAGPADSAISRWIQEYQLGWVLNHQNIESVCEGLSQFMETLPDTTHQAVQLQNIYRSRFAREKILTDWHSLLSSELVDA